MSAAERVEAVLVRYRRALSFDQAILIAASEAAGNALDPYRSGDAAVILHAEALLQRGLRVRDAISEARIAADAAAADPHTQAHTARIPAEPSLDDVLRDPRAGPFISGDEAATTPQSCDNRIDLVLLERHEVGPHAIELWAPPPANRNRYNLLTVRHRDRHVHALRRRHRRQGLDICRVGRRYMALLRLRPARSEAPRDPEAASRLRLCSSRQTQAHSSTRCQPAAALTSSSSQRAAGGKSSLPARRRYRETPEVVAGIRRQIRAVGRRIATEDPADLRFLLDLERELQRAWRIAVVGIRGAGFTDREIGEILGTSRQAVEQRWPRDQTS